MKNGIELTVSAVSTRKGSTETSFEKRFAHHLDQIGVFSYHTNDVYQTGIPDRYVIGGNWIEFKVMNISGKRSVNPLRLFSPEQKRYLDMLHEAGDRTWAAVRFQGSIDPIVVFMPWHKFKTYQAWDLTDINIFGWRDFKAGVHGVFGREIRSYSDGYLYDQP